MKDRSEWVKGEERRLFESARAAFVDTTNQETILKERQRE